MRTACAVTMTGSQKAKEVAAAGLSDLARGAIVEREQTRKRRDSLALAQDVAEVTLYALQRRVMKPHHKTNTPTMRRRQ